MISADTLLAECNAQAKLRDDCLAQAQALSKQIEELRARAQAAEGARNLAARLLEQAKANAALLPAEQVN